MSTRVADVVFDAPVDQPFSYLVPEGMTVRVGQRVAAPLRSVERKPAIQGRPRGKRDESTGARGAERVGLVVAVREDDKPRMPLRPLARVVDAAPLLSRRALEFVRVLAAESLTSLG